MAEFAKEVFSIAIEDEMRTSYIDYAMSVIVGRALPDLRDGLKPVHRRVLYAMSELGNDWNKPHKKSARIVGDVIGKYHPHGDTAVYDTIVRMAQTFSMRYVLVDGQGNFGSVDGDAPAAMRYTEIRMAKLAHEILADLDKDTVDFSPNYDGSEQIPDVLPTRFPNLLINGSSGIAVGMATNIPTHNLGEVIDATVALIDNSALSIADLMNYMPGPDFPTGGFINGRAGIAEAYLTGRGRIRIRARTEFETEERNNKTSIIVTELPYQVNKARLLEKIGELVRDKKLEGIVGLRDESDKSGMRMVIELRRGEQPEVVLNNLLAQTQLEVVFGINMVALDDGQPRLLNLKQMLDAFIQHRREVVTRRSRFELAKARERAHLLEGLAIALANIDPIIALIKAAKTPAEAKDALLAQVWPQGTVAELLGRAGADQTRPIDLEAIYGLQADGYHFSPQQAQAILDLRLHRLTGLEKDKIHEEFFALLEDIQRLLKILSDTATLHQVIRDELLAVKERFNDKRRTEILGQQEDVTTEDLIPEEAVVVTISNEGYAKTQSLEQYRAQHRGGRGKAAAAVKDEDCIKNLVIASTHDTLMCFSSAGKVYWTKVYAIPQASRQSKGRPIVNLLPLDDGEQISAILPLKVTPQCRYIFMSTKQGKVKKVAVEQFARQRSSGLIALDLTPGDELMSAIFTSGNDEIMLFSTAGKAIRFHESEVRETGRTAQGVRGIRLTGDAHVISALKVEPEQHILAATARGYGQRTRFEDYRAISRGGQGVQVIRVNERNGVVVAAIGVALQDNVLLISNQGTLVRIHVEEISVVGRNTQGVRLMSLSEGERLVGVEPVRELEGKEIAAEEGRVPELEAVLEQEALEQENPLDESE